jgi:hypothetical protein
MAFSIAVLAEVLNVRRLWSLEDQSVDAAHQVRGTSRQSRQNEWRCLWPRGAIWGFLLGTSLG